MGMQFCIKFLVQACHHVSRKRRNKHRISRFLKGCNSKEGRRGETYLNFSIPRSIEQTFLDVTGISAARSSENHEKSMRNKVQYWDWKLNTQDKKIDNLTIEVMTREEKEHILLDVEEKSLLLASKAEESSAAALAKLDAVKGRFLASLVGGPVAMLN